MVEKLCDRVGIIFDGVLVKESYLKDLVTEDKNLEELEINSLYSQNSKSNVKPQIISKKTNIELYEKYRIN